MLNLFPIQFLAPLAYLLLRLCVGVILIYLGKQRITHRSPKTTLVVEHITSPSSSVLLCMGVFEIIVGIILILGLYTQLASLAVLTLTSMQLLFHKRFTTEPALTRTFLFLLFFTSLSLFITGAGALAFDLPI